MTDTMTLDEAMQSRDHRITLDMLCSIPPEPALVPLRDLADDFGFKNVTTVRRVLSRLDELGVRVRTLQGGRDVGMAVQVPRAEWPYVRPLAQKFWNLNHGAQAYDSATE